MKNNKDEFFYIVKDILESEPVQKLKLYKHHYGFTRLEHCLSVSYKSYLICKFLHLDYKSIARAGLLHDLFFYDCETKAIRPKHHVWTHPKVALDNAEKLFNLNKKERDIILKHMWPVTLVPPKYIESFIITLVDKYCAFKEWSYYGACKMLIWYRLKLGKNGDDSLFPLGKKRTVLIFYSSS